MPDSDALFDHQESMALHQPLLACEAPSSKGGKNNE